MNQIIIGSCISLGIFLVAQFVTVIWWMATVTVTLKNIDDDLKLNFKEIEKEAEKREKEMSAMWLRVDELRTCKNFTPAK